MDITKLAAAPQLIKVELDSDDIIKNYKEAITFYTLDRLPLETFMKLSDADGNMNEMIEIVKPLLLDKDGNMIIVDDITLPNDVLIAAIGKIVEQLGK